MNILNNSNYPKFPSPHSRISQSFKGYDARPLKGLVLSLCEKPDNFEIIEQLSNIGKKDGFSVYFSNHSRIFQDLKKIREIFIDCKEAAFHKWTQDSFVVTPEKKIFSLSFCDDVYAGKRIAKKVKGNYEVCSHYIEGGNLFFMKNGNKNELLVGADDVKNTNLDKIKKLYGVSDVHIIPQADYHLDLFIRPLANKKVLVADDKETIKCVQKGIRSIEKYILTGTSSEREIKELDDVKKGLEKFIKEFKKDVNKCQNPAADEIAGVLENNGFLPVRVPGRVYSRIPDRHRDDLVQYMNYMNAIIHEKPDGSLTYITNKSPLNEKFKITPEISEKIGFDFEKMFIKSLEPYVKKEDVHFISGKNNYIANVLENEGGGIHCLCNELPAELFA